MHVSLDSFYMKLCPFVRIQVALALTVTQHTQNAANIMEALAWDIKAMLQILVHALEAETTCVRIASCCVKHSTAEGCSEDPQTVETHSKEAGWRA